MSFLIQYFKHPKLTGTFIESGPNLLRAVTNELKDKKNILELGAGTGPISKEILKILPQDGTLKSVEIIPELYKDLEKIKDERFQPILGNANDFNFISEETDCIVSGLPLSIMEQEELNNILSNIKKKNTLFIQYKYKNESKLLKEYFENVRTIRVWKHFPLAVVHVCNN